MSYTTLPLKQRTFKSAYKSGRCYRPKYTHPLEKKSATPIKGAALFIVQGFLFYALLWGLCFLAVL